MSVGSYSPNNAKAEILNITSGDWFQVADYPYADYIYNYVMVYYNDGFLIFGGFPGAHKSTIARFDVGTTTWSKIGDLNAGRARHNVIYDGEDWVFGILRLKFIKLYKTLN